MCVCVFFFVWLGFLNPAYHQNPTGADLPPLKISVGLPLGRQAAGEQWASPAAPKAIWQHLNARPLGSKHSGTYPLIAPNPCMYCLPGFYSPGAN